MKDRTIIWLAAGGIIFWLVALKPAVLESLVQHVEKLVRHLLH
jgi:hypothetical protein